MMNNKCFMKSAVILVVGFVMFFGATASQAEKLFEIGWYDNPWTSVDMPDHADHNVVSITAKNTQSVFWDSAHAHGIKGNIWIPEELVVNAEYNDIAELVNYTKNHPALLTWQLMEEMQDRPGDVLPEFQQAYATIKANDPNHPVEAAFDHDFWDMGEFINYVDKVHTFAYPVQVQHSSPSPAMDRVVLQCNWQAQQAATAGITETSVFVGQSFKTGTDPTDLRWTTYYETRYMSFCPLTVGFEGGIHYYKYGWYETYAFTRQEQLDHIDASVYPIMTQLHLIKDAMESEESLGSVSLAASNYTYNSSDEIDGEKYGVAGCPNVPNVTILLKKYYDELYENYVIIAVDNLANALSGVTLTVSNLGSDTYIYETMQNDSGDGYWTTSGFPGYSWSGGDLIITTNFAGFDVHVFRVRKARSPYCGSPANPYPEGDLNEDCTVNFEDYSQVAGQFLECTAPECD